MRKNEDLKAFSGQYPYGSELFGIYQTLLGWKGARARSWFTSGYERERAALRDRLFRGIAGEVDADINVDGFIESIGEVRIGRPASGPPAASPRSERPYRRPSNQGRVAGPADGMVRGGHSSSAGGHVHRP